MHNLPIFDSQNIGDNSVFDPSQSMYIEASAGTGKTYTIQQIVARMIHDGTRLNQILLVTYTEKAAGELKDRIRLKIQEVIEHKHLIKDVGSPLSPEKLAYFETALRELDSAQIFTIHSFCQKTLKIYAYDAWRPFDMQLVDDTLVKNIIHQKMRDEWPKDKDFQAILGISEDTDQNNDAYEEKLNKVAKDIENILINAIPKYYLTFENENSKEDEKIISLVEPDDTLLPFLHINNFESLSNFNDFKNIFTIFKNHKTFKLSIPTNKNSKRSIETALELLRTWKRPEKLISGYPSKYDNKWEWPDELAQAYNDLNQIKNNLEKTKDAYNILLNRFLYNIFPRLYLEWRKEKIDHKYESYQDMITVVYQAVVNPGPEDSNANALRKELRKAYRYAIIDEFQDTNRLQWDIFRTLFLNVEGHALFVVGDPKQSIYAFQGADLTVYQEAIRTIGNGKRLATNYRSTTEMIEACNHLFSTEDGSQFFNDDALAFSRSESPQNKVSTTFDDQPTKPVWLSSDIDSKRFAKLAAQKIVECCTLTNGKTRLQVFDKSDSQHLRNVTFKDFAILARTRTEFSDIEAALKEIGIPFVRYKDDNLFDSRECMQWIALFRAIDADDFTAYNRRILSEALMTDFFHPVIQETKLECGLQNKITDTISLKLLTATQDKYDDPHCRERLQIAKYHALARKYKWAEMLECIYRESKIETQTARDLSKLQSLAKFQQIGNYSVEYLYTKRCTLQELIKHLDNLQKKDDDTSDKDGNLVARGTDFDAVQLMTIHASKGLEFPVVIGVAGFKGYNDKAKGPFTYHDPETHCKMLGFDDASKAKQKEEDIKEWHRLFYVAYTRASALLILPKYTNACDAFLTQSLDAFASQEAYVKLLTASDASHPLPPAIDTLRSTVQAILNTQTKQETAREALEAQQAVIQNLQSRIGQKSLIQHSYSSLANKVQPKDPETLDQNGKSSEFASDGNEIDETYTHRAPVVDLHPCHIFHEQDYQDGCTSILDVDYPKGKQLGNAIHEVFEKIDFTKAQMPLEDFKMDSEVNDLIDKTYAKYGLPLKRHPAWRNTTSEFVWHTLNAKLPGIEGSQASGDTFSLCDLSANEHFAEVEFFLEGDLIHANHIPQTGEYFSKGFMDLIFVREINGTKRYAILDWKSDRIDNDDYAKPEVLKDKVDHKYAVQRVLYAYCLIQWLKQFYNLPEEAIFEHHFGGIYYAFVRGTACNTAKGIYAQTWPSYQELKNNYKKLINLMFKSASQENNHD